MSFAITLRSAARWLLGTGPAQAASRPPFPRPPGRITEAAFTLLETMVASAVIVIALGAIFLVSSRCMGITRSSQGVGVASAILQERMQQLQAANWETLTDSDSYLDQVWTDPEDGTTENVDGLLKNATKSMSALRLANIVESVRVSAYRPIVVATPEPAAITARRAASVATLTSSMTNLADEKMVRVDLRLTWTEGSAALPRSLGLSAVVARK